MRSFLRSKLALVLTASLMLFAFSAPATASTLSPYSTHVSPATTGVSRSKGNALCRRLDKSIRASAGAKVYCFGQQTTKQSQTKKPGGTSTALFGSNVDAASPAEDQTIAGVQAYGQSEVSVASIDSYVVEAWNDATGIFAPCPSPKYQEEVTGFGFSTNGGVSFIDEGGLPNDHCNSDLYFGDPSVEAWQSGGSDYFYISSLYDGAFGTPSFLAIAACRVTGQGSSAKVNCSQPIIAATSTQCDQNDGCSFLDKEFLSIDPARGRLYIAYTEFGSDYTQNLSNGQIELSVCDIGTAAGGTGLVGGTAARPVCEQGNGTAPYYVAAPATSCVNQGAYPAVDVAHGDVYIAYEYNLDSNTWSWTNCASVPTKNIVSYIPFSCLALASVSTCNTPPVSRGIPIVSMVASSIVGYNRYDLNDFPRIAVSSQDKTVSIVWNDARSHPLGDILLQSFSLATLAPIQSVPVQINNDASGTPHLLPSVRNADAHGNLNVVWYDRRLYPTSAFTDVYAALGFDPRTTKTPAKNLLVTTTPTNWLNVSSNTSPNFGDYTDSYVATTASSPYTGTTLYVAWSDGRLGYPQPFEAKALTS